MSPCRPALADPMLHPGRLGICSPPGRHQLSPAPFQPNTASRQVPRPRRVRLHSLSLPDSLPPPAWRTPGSGTGKAYRAAPSLRAVPRRSSAAPSLRAVPRRAKPARLTAPLAIHRGALHTTPLAPQGEGTGVRHPSVRTGKQKFTNAPRNAATNGNATGVQRTPDLGSVTCRRRRQTRKGWPRARPSLPECGPVSPQPAYWTDASSYSV
jgi:hypothetical protein